MKPRASRTAVMVASVPVETIRTRSAAGTRSWTIAARLASSGVDAPKDSPRSTAACTAARTAGWACPSSAGPQEQTRSTYSAPSASVRYGPFAETIKRGVPPTEPNARTGELTPPGISWRARSKSSSLRGWLEVMVPILSVQSVGAVQFWDADASRVATRGATSVPNSSIERIIALCGRVPLLYLRSKRSTPRFFLSSAIFAATVSGEPT